MPGTQKELVQTLQDRNVDGRYDDIIVLALAGQYHDFKSDYAAPKMQLVRDLRRFPELEDIALLVMKGEYDDE